MKQAIEISVDKAVDYLDKFPGTSKTALRIAINQVADRKAIRLFRDKIQEEVNFPTGYVNQQRLFVSKRASDANLTAEITGRHRATSLARFTSGGTPGGRQSGVTVTVKPGSPEQMPGAFFVRLRAGASATQDNFNLGLAIRLKPGQTIRNKKQLSSVQLDHNVYILYGPSIDQVLDDVAEDQSPVILEAVEEEFFRQVDRLF